MGPLLSWVGLLIWMIWIRILFQVLQRGISFLTKNLSWISSRNLVFVIRRCGKQLPSTFIRKRKTNSPRRCGTPPSYRDNKHQQASFLLLGRSSRELCRAESSHIGIQIFSWSLAYAVKFRYKEFGFSSKELGTLEPLTWPDGCCCYLLKNYSCLPVRGIEGVEFLSHFDGGNPYSSSGGAIDGSH